MLERVFQRINNFEKILFLVGLMATIVGFYLINRVFVADPSLSWAVLQSIFLWLMLLFLIILTDSNESIKEELKDIMSQHVQETKLLKKISNEQLQEIKLLRKDLKRRK
jgi:Ca2+/Na+ antiporter